MLWRIIQTLKGWNRVKWCASLGFVQPRTRNTPRLRDSLFVSREFCICIQSIHYLYSDYSSFVSGEFFLWVQSTHYLCPVYPLLYSPHMLTDETTFVWDSAPFLAAGVYSGFTSGRSLSYKILLMYKNHRFGKWKISRTNSCIILFQSNAWLFSGAG